LDVKRTKSAMVDEKTKFAVWDEKLTKISNLTDKNCQRYAKISYICTPNKLNRQY